MAFIISNATGRLRIVTDRDMGVLLLVGFSNPLGVPPLGPRHKIRYVTARPWRVTGGGREIPSSPQTFEGADDDIDQGQGNRVGPPAGARPRRGGGVPRQFRHDAR